MLLANKLFQWNFWVFLHEMFRKQTNKLSTQVHSIKQRLHNPHFRSMMCRLPPQWPLCDHPRLQSAAPLAPEPEANELRALIVPLPLPSPLLMVVISASVLGGVIPFGFSRLPLAQLLAPAAPQNSHRSFCHRRRSFRLSWKPENELSKYPNIKPTYMFVYMYVCTAGVPNRVFPMPTSLPYLPTRWTDDNRAELSWTWELWRIEKPHDEIGSCKTLGWV